MGLKTQQPGLAAPLKQSEEPEFIRESADLEVLNDLFKLIEITEPTLLISRDALSANGKPSSQLQSINATLSKIRDLKMKFLPSAAQSPHIEHSIG